MLLDEPPNALDLQDKFHEKVNNALPQFSHTTRVWMTDKASQNYQMSTKHHPGNKNSWNSTIYPKDIVSSLIHDMAPKVKTMQSSSYRNLTWKHASFQTK